MFTFLNTEMYFCIFSAGNIIIKPLVMVNFFKEVKKYMILPLDSFFL